MPRKTSSSSSSKAVAGPPREGALATGYLVLYNAVSAVLWAVVLARTTRVAAASRPAAVHAAVGDWAKWTQTLALLEVLHALIGLVRAPVATTAIQVLSRLNLVWAIVHPFPHLARTNPAYVSMLLAWSLTEVIRYPFFAVTKATGAAPRPLLWLRYSTFLVLYPIGITSEALMIWAAIPDARALRKEYAWALYALLAIYVPGSYVMYTYMMGQRRKVLRAAAADAKKTR